MYPFIVPFVSFVLHLISQVYCKETMLWFWKLQIKVLEKVWDLVALVLKVSKGKFTNEFYKNCVNTEISGLWWPSPGTGCPLRLWSLLLKEYPKPLGHGPGLPALDAPGGAGGSMTFTGLAPTILWFCKVMVV